MARRATLLIAAIGLVLAIVMGLPRTTGTPPAGLVPAGGSTAVAPRASAGDVTHPEVGFRSHERLAEHFAKHGREFDAVSETQYLRMAQALRDRPAGGDVLEAVRRDGTVTRFDRASGAFLAFERDGTLRTFFKPTAGEAYFRRQLSREHGR